MSQGGDTPFGTGDMQRDVLQLLARTHATGERQVDLMDALPFDWGRHAVLYDGSVSLAAVRARTRIFIREEARIHVPRIFPASVCATTSSLSADRGGHRHPRVLAQRTWHGEARRHRPAPPSSMALWGGGGLHGKELKRGNPFRHGGQAARCTSSTGTDTFNR